MFDVLWYVASLVQDASAGAARHVLPAHDTFLPEDFAHASFLQVSAPAWLDIHNTRYCSVEPLAVEQQVQCSHPR
jgi:hypothetical protein